MADGNDDPRAEDLPGPAYESCEAAELACPAERSGHVAVGDGRRMFVWGGYKVSGPGHGVARRYRVRVRGPAGGSARPRPTSRLTLGFPPPLACFCFPRVWESSLEPRASPKAPGLLSR